MNTTTRYILTATAVGVGLFTVGATANALGGNDGANLDPIGDPVVLPSGATLSGDSLERVDAPDAEDLDDLDATPTPTGSGMDDYYGDDDDADDVEDDDDGVEIEDEDEHGVEIEDESDDDSVDD